MRMARLGVARALRAGRALALRAEPRRKREKCASRPCGLRSLTRERRECLVRRGVS